MEWGTVVWDTEKNRPAAVVQASVLFDHLPTVLLARGTAHSKSRAPDADGVQRALPSYAYHGEVPLAFPDPGSSAYYPAALKHRLGLFQSFHLYAVDRNDFTNGRLEYKGAPSHLLLAQLRHDINIVIHGGGWNQPTRAPRKTPASLSDLQQGAVLQVSRRDRSPYRAAVVSHSDFHKWHPMSTVVVVEEQDAKATHVAERWNLALVDTLNFYSAYREFDAEVVGTLHPDEVAELLARVDVLVG